MNTQRFNPLRNWRAVTRHEKFPDLFDRRACVRCLEQLAWFEPPNEVSGADRIGVKRQAIAWFETYAGRCDLKIRQHSQDLFHHEGSRLVLLCDTKGIGPQRRDAKVVEAVIPAEEGKIVDSPKGVEVAPRSRWGNESDVDESHGGGIFEKKSEKVALVKKPDTAFVAKRTVLRIGEVETPGVLRHRKVAA